MEERLSGVGDKMKWVKESVKSKKKKKTHKTFKKCEIL